MFERKRKKIIGDCDRTDIFTIYETKTNNGDRRIRITDTSDDNPILQCLAIILFIPAVIYLFVNFCIKIYYETHETKEEIQAKNNYEKTYLGGKYKLEHPEEYEETNLSKHNKYNSIYRKKNFKKKKIRK